MPVRIPPDSMFYAHSRDVLSFGDVLQSILAVLLSALHDVP